MDATTVVILLGVALLALLVLTYNRLIALKNNRQQSFADIDVQLKLRFDLIPNIVNSVKGYKEFEASTLTKITELRTASQSATTIDSKIQAENELTSTIKSIFAIAENYPDLKANQNFLQLQDTLRDVEAKISAARRFFNNATKEYNTYIMSFPNNILAGILGFKTGEFFDLATEPNERENVKVSM